ncbi:hypothetical protein B5M09_001860 [Aphanomyces astaci]|uniref:AB hydrolase-1 domain-containing protein n=1 Tax=Aphanomyces astaci TaxID=112090 RepID=A0A3R7Y1H9_APHAT|nr:hypothetical protein B5M09_001860 [Aphanomyces astaci]
MSGQLRFDGWYACSESTFDASVNLVAECGKYTLPLCHPGVCSDDTRRTLDVFVKRIRAVNSTNPKILWMLQGGPGYASADPNAAGFSITSAATDLLTIISATSSPTQEVYMYGVSYGTIWVQRAMLVLPHLFPSLHNIRGFVLDGVVTHSGPHRTVFSDWDVNHGIVATKYFDLCRQNAFCASKFPDRTLYDTTLLLYVKLNAASHACNALVKTNFGDADGLKMLFSEYLQHSTLRVLIPVLVYRLQRCQTADIVLQTMLNSVQDLMDAPHMGTSFYSELVRNVIGYSDLWELPTPTQAVLQAVRRILPGTYSQECVFCIEIRPERRRKWHGQLIDRVLHIYWRHRSRLRCH